MARTALTMGSLTLLLAGCASSGAVPSTKPGATPGAGTTAVSKPASSANERRAILADNSGVMYGDAPIDQTRDFSVAASLAQKAIREAFTGYSIPITLDDAASQRIGNPDFFRSREFMGARMTALLECGNSMTGPNAASFRIFMSLVARTKSNGKGGTTVSVQLIASARDLASGSSSDKLPCGSTGKIEQRLLDEIGKRLGL